MELKHINLDQLTPDKHNVRKHGGKACDDLIPSIRSLGIIQPLLVRPSDEKGRYDIVAGQRRYHALNKIAETDDVDPVPCIVMKHTDDASAIEASLAENIARLPMDEIDQYKAFAALVGQGHTVEEIGTIFGVTERLVKQRLAIANLIGPILTAYRKGDINADTVRILTMASKQQQKDWLALHKSDDYAPSGRHLKAWLFGGADIPTRNALFDLEGYRGTITTDLFGDTSYFDDAQAFWERQNQSIAEARQTYLDAGWNAVVIQDIGDIWCSWEMSKRAKSKGGKVYVQIAHDGEVTFHEGYITSDEARRLDKKAESGTKDKPTNHTPELTKAAQNYLALHRHAAVRADLLTHQGLALRIAVAQIIAGSDLWDVKPDPQKASKPEIKESLATNTAELLFQTERQTVIDLLGLTDEPESDEDITSCEEDDDDLSQDETETVVQRYSHWEMGRNPDAILAKLIALDDDTVTRVLTFVVAECLPCGTSWVEAAGMAMKTDMSACWTPDQTFLDLVRDKNTLNLLIEQVAGKDTADAHVTSTGKVQRQILTNCIKGERETKEGAWDLPYMRFPMKDYTDQFGIDAIDAWIKVRHHYEA